MNANFGIILRKSTVETLLLPLMPVVWSWGGEEVEAGERKFVFPSLENIEFQLYPVTEFVRDHLPVHIRDEKLSYACMTGQSLDEYEEWIWNGGVTTPEMHRFEKGLIDLIREACGGTILFAPEGERLGEFENIGHSEAIDLLRLNVKNLDESNGFLATIDQ